MPDESPHFEGATVKIPFEPDTEAIDGFFDELSRRRDEFVAETKRQFTELAEMVGSGPGREQEPGERSEAVRVADAPDETPESSRPEGDRMDEIVELLESRLRVDRGEEPEELHEKVREIVRGVESGEDDLADGEDGGGDSDTVLQIKDLIENEVTVLLASILAQLQEGDQPL